MNWYKFSLEISNLHDRNLLNARITYLESLAQRLEKASKIANQTQRGARTMVQQIMADKRLSSFPKVLEILDAADKNAMDSPKKFQMFCRAGVDEILLRVGDLIEERHKYTQEGRPAKGWFN